MVAVPSRIDPTRAGRDLQGKSSDAAIGSERGNQVAENPDRGSRNPETGGGSPADLCGGGLR